MLAGLNSLLLSFNYFFKNRTVIHICHQNYAFYPVDTSLLYNQHLYIIYDITNLCNINPYFLSD